MPHYVCKIGTIQANHWPNESQVKPLFLRYSEHDWTAGGATDASFFAYGIDGTEGTEPYTSRIDAKLCIWDHPTFGFCLYYSKTGGVFSDHYFSLGDESKLGKVVETRNGEQLQQGLFINGEQAWLAVKDFLMTGGVRSSRIQWMADADL